MKIEVRKKEDIFILDLIGNIDINASNFVEKIGWIISNKGKNIICNFEEVNLIDYVGISMIAVAYKNILNHGGKIKLYNVPAHLKNLFSIVGLDRVFIYYATEDQAIESIKEEKRINQISEAQLRRRFERAPANITIEFKRQILNTDLFFKGKILNLSAIGAFVVCEHIFPLNDLLNLRMHLVPKPGILNIDAKVIWISDKQLQPRDFPGMGFEFYGISAQTQKNIIEFVEKNLTHSI
ncbi:MAG: PilZ domain-containing protein [Candidatus Omnitrophota bacterium]